VATLPAAPVLALLPFNTVTAGNAAGAFNVVSSAFTAPRAGSYLFGAGLTIQTPTATDALVGVVFYKNGVAQTFTTSLSSSSTSPSNAVVTAGTSALFDLQPGDIVTVYYTLVDAANQVVSSYFWGQPGF